MLRSAIISGKVTCLVVPGRCFHRFLLLFEGRRSYFWSYRCPFLNFGKKLSQFWRCRISYRILHFIRVDSLPYIVDTQETNMFIVAIHLPTNRLSTHKAVVYGDPRVGLQQVVSHRRRSNTTMSTLTTPT